MLDELDAPLNRDDTNDYGPETDAATDKPNSKHKKRSAKQHIKPALDWMGHHIRQLLRWIGIALISAQLWTAAATIVIAWAGAMARAGETVGLYPAEMVASAILLAGFLMAGTLDKGAREVAAHSRERREHEAEAHSAEMMRPPDV